MLLPTLAIPKILEYALETIKDLAPDEWDGSVQVGDADSEEIDSVEVVDGGVNGDKYWVKTKFTHEGTEHLLQASGPLKTAGARGGGDEVKLDGVDVSGEDFVLKLIVYRFRLRISMSYKYIPPAGGAVRYRFDGTVS